MEASDGSGPFLSQPEKSNLVSGCADSLPRRPQAHRLDSPTAGILCCGKTRGALKFLSQAFADRTATKRYRALLVGRLEVWPLSSAASRRGDDAPC